VEWSTSTQKILPKSFDNNFIMPSAKNESWHLTPFETPEGLTEVWLYEECWGANIHFVTNSPNHEAYCKWMNRVFKIGDGSVKGLIELNLHSGEMVSIGYTDGPGLKACVIKMPGVWKERFENITTLVHEAAHVTFKILSSKGLKHNEETEEAFCYFQESIVKRLVEAMRKKVIPFKKSTDKNTTPKKSKNASNRPRIKKP
jgi:hypothetical protein